MPSSGGQAFSGFQSPLGASRPTPASHPGRGHTCSSCRRPPCSSSSACRAGPGSPRPPPLVLLPPPRKDDSPIPCVSPSRPPGPWLEPHPVVPWWGAAPPQDHPAGRPRTACLLGPGPGHLGLLSLWGGQRALSCQLRGSQARIIPLLPLARPPAPPASWPFSERVSCPIGHPRTAGGASGHGGRGEALA